MYAVLQPNVQVLCRFNQGARKSQKTTKLKLLNENSIRQQIVHIFNDINFNNTTRTLTNRQTTTY